MARGPRYHVPFRRRREGKTDYRRRLALLKGRKPRAVVRKTLRNTIVQFVEFDFQGDRILASAVSKELERFGWKGAGGNVPAAYLTGYLAARRVLKRGVKRAVLDMGLHPPTKGGRVFAALKGILDAGVEVPHGEEILPDESRIRGEHISKDVPAMFEAVKEKLEEL